MGNEKVNALDVQVAGGHYKSMKIQPIEFSEANKLSPCQFSVVKYICRHKAKNGIEDLKKARHFIALLAQLEYGVNIVELEREEEVPVIKVDLGGEDKLIRHERSWEFPNACICPNCKNEISVMSLRRLNVTRGNTWACAECKVVSEWDGLKFVMEDKMGIDVMSEEEETAWNNNTNNRRL